MIVSRLRMIFLSLVHCLGTVSMESLEQADFREQLREFGFEIIGEGLEGLRACVASEIPRWTSSIRRTSSGCSLWVPRFSAA